MLKRLSMVVFSVLGFIYLPYYTYQLNKYIQITRFEWSGGNLFFVMKEKMQIPVEWLCGALLIMIEGFLLGLVVALIVMLIKWIVTGEFR